MVEYKKNMDSYVNKNKSSRKKCSIIKKQENNSLKNVGRILIKKK